MGQAASSRDASGGAKQKSWMGDVGQVRMELWGGSWTSLSRTSLTGELQFTRAFVIEGTDPGQWLGSDRNWSLVG